MKLLDPAVEWRPEDLPKGAQEPTHRLVPPFDGSYGDDAAAFAEYCGIDLMLFQRQGLVDDLGFVRVRTASGDLVERWAAKETVELVSRRNGKTRRLVVLLLYAVFVLGEKRILYTAHRDDTAKEVFDEVVRIIKATPRLWAEIIDKGPRRANGQRSIETKSGQIVYFRTRGSDSGRGQGYERLILDEDQNLTTDEAAALLPLVSGEPNGQVNYAGSAGGRHSTVQASKRRAYDRRERDLCFRGWLADPDDDLDDLDLVARVNPRLGHGAGLDHAYVAKELSTWTRAQFGRERCGVATYPRAEGEDWIIPKERWEAALDPASNIAPKSPLVFVLEADRQLGRGTIGVAGFRADGAVHIEVTDHQPGVTWMVDRAKDLTSRHGGVAAVDPKGPLHFLVRDLTEAGVPLATVADVDLRDAAAWITTALTPHPDPSDPDGTLPPPGVYHRGGVRLTQALAAAEARKLLDRWAFRREVAAEVDQGPITSTSLAGHLLVRDAKKNPPPRPQRVSDAQSADPSGGRGHRHGPYRTPPARRPSDELATAGF